MATTNVQKFAGDVDVGGTVTGDGSGLTTLNGSQVTTGTVAAARIASLDASKITTGTLGTARIPNLDGSKITTGTVAAARIDNLDGSKITTGTVAAARIDNLDASKITTGTLGADRIPNLDGSKITSGSITASVDTTGSVKAASLYTDEYIYHDGDTNTRIRFPAADTITMDTAGSERLRVTSAGYVGIGTNNPGARFDVVSPASTASFTRVRSVTGGYSAFTQYTNGNGTTAYFGSDGIGLTAYATGAATILSTASDIIFVPSTSSGIRFRVQNSWNYNYNVCYNNTNMGWSGSAGWDTNITLQAPNVVYYGARCRFWATYSSRKLKENFEPVLDSLDKVKQLNGVYYTWKQGQGDNVPPPDDYDTTHMVKQQKHIGFVADEVAEVLPWVCTFDENGEANGLDYGAVTPVLANAIKELDDKIGKSEATSDDRLKDNEEYLRNATQTLMKLKPQLYDKKESFTSNVYHHEAGLIAQDIWYDAPELRFAVKPGLLSEVPIDPPLRSDDPREDPDYSKWGPNPASVDYNYLVPYTIKSIQEVVTELPRQKTQVTGITPSNINESRGLVVISDTNDFKNEVPKLSLSTGSYDKRCFGVISHSNTYSIDNEILIDTIGTGYIWVINSSNIESGDYLTTSNIPGYAMKQNDNLLHNYTICKSTIDCNFKPEQKTVKRIKQELSNVTYYIKTKLYEITKEQYDSMDDRYKTSREHSFYIKEDYTKVTEKGGYDKFEHYAKDVQNASEPTNPTKREFITIEEWNSLESNVQDEYYPYYSNLSTTTVSLEDYTSLDEAEKAKCTFTTKTIYSYKVQEESKNPIPGYEPEIRQEYVNVLDENGQIQWEDTERTEASYKIRYLDANSDITDESNAVHVAALIGCKYV